MSAATVLVMDLGGVTCRWQPERRLAELSALSGQPPSAIDQSVFESGFDDAGERGQFSLDEFTETLLSILGVAATDEAIDAVRNCWASAFDPDPSVLRLIRASTCPTALFTNNGPLLEDGIEAEASLAPVRDAFDHLVFSWRLGTTKPDPRAFTGAAGLLATPPGQLLLVDDSEANVAAARAAGWQAHHFTTALDLQATLGTHGLI